MRKWIVVSVLAIGTFVAGTAFGTPSSGVSAVTVRGNVVSPIKLKEEFANGGAVRSR